MKNKPLISIIIPVYNVEAYIKRCVDSVISQSYDKLEIILVDDGSTDYSGKICDEYAQKDKRIEVVHKKNGGLSDARNVGIKLATADYIAFIDSDDYVATTYVECLVKILLEYNADIAACEYYSGIDEKIPENKVYSETIHCYDSKDMLSNWHGKLKHVETVAWNKLYKKKLFIENDIYYPNGYFNEDVQTTHLLVGKAQKIVVTNKKLYYYFRRKNSIMSVVSKKKLMDCIYSQNERLFFFERNGYREAYERLAIKRQKQYMLDYCKFVCFGDVNDVGNEIIEMFNESYDKVCGMKKTHIWEKLLFLLFKYFHCAVKLKMLFQKGYDMGFKK